MQVSPQPPDKSVSQQLKELRERVLAKRDSSKLKLSAEVKRKLRKKTRMALRTYGVDDLEDSREGEVSGLGLAGA